MKKFCFIAWFSLNINKLRSIRRSRTFCLKNLAILLLSLAENLEPQWSKFWFTQGKVDGRSWLETDFDESEASSFINSSQRIVLSRYEKIFWQMKWTIWRGRANQMMLSDSILIWALFLWCLRRNNCWKRFLLSEENYILKVKIFLLRLHVSFIKKILWLPEKLKLKIP